MTITLDWWMIPSAMTLALLIWLITPSRGHQGYGYAVVELIEFLGYAIVVLASWLMWALLN